MPTDLKPLTEEELKSLEAQVLEDGYFIPAETGYYESELYRLKQEVAAHRAAWEKFEKWYVRQRGRLYAEEVLAEYRRLRAEAGLGSE